MSGAAKAISGGKSKGKSSQSSTSTTQDYGSEVWRQQSPFLQDLYRRGQGTLNTQDRLAQLQAQGMLGDAQQGVRRASGMFGRGRNAIEDARGAFQRFQRPEIDPAFTAYSQNIGQQFREQVLPSMRGEAAMAGGMGGSRAQIGQALAGQRAMQSIGEFGAQAYAGQQERALGAAQGMLGAAGEYGNLGAGMLGGSQQSLANADFARNMPWYGLQQYGGLLGGPTMIDKGGTGGTTSKGKSKQGGWDAGLQF